MKDRFLQQKESFLEKVFTQKLRAAGCLVYKFTSPGNAGVPDRIVITPAGVVWFVELKRPGQQLRALQKATAKLLTGHNANFFVVNGEDALDAFLQEVGADVGI